MQIKIITSWSGGDEPVSDSGGKGTGVFNGDTG